MKRMLFPALATAVLLATPAFSFDMANMSTDERAAFQEEIRAYLLENPEVIMEAVAVLEERKAQDQAQGDDQMVKVNAEALFNDANSWAGGNLDGDITVVEFLDYRCGYCRKANAEVDELVKSDGNIRFIIKEFPILGEASLLSSRFAIATRTVAGDDAYKAAHDVLIEFKGDMNDTSMRRIASELGLDADAIIAEMTSEKTESIIAETNALARRLQISGTPTFVMGGQMVRGYVPLANMTQIVAEARNP